MKKKTIVFLCLALLFLIAVPECFSSSLLTGIICIGLCALFAFLAYRSFRMPKTDTAAIGNSPNSFTSPPEQSFVSGTPHNYTNSETPQPAETPITAAYEFVTVKLAGVTFKNDDGTERQQILRALKFHDAPYNTEIDVSIKEYQFDNERAYGVYLNDTQIGNIPRHLIQFIYDNFQRIESISSITAYGGGRDADGKPKSYGAEITIRLYKDTE